MTDLATAQQALVAALVAGGELPEGFDPAAVLATKTALRRKRAGEVAARWPFLAASYGNDWPRLFAAWAESRPPQGSLRDGWDFARSMGTALPPLAREELDAREREYTYDGTAPPTPRPRSLWSRLRRR
ncbi:hypothetical protein [Dactylosporangium matsuzakiense]|uniref:SCO6045-like C-terminal domain-containing protein n=1 Tax=Dactylosporangium matsuzakiense TaxID=53360 RepID=A0A9W6NTJ6_9ACTN|nr:hypothetical protein [Dactylosporangium matsuzakiense]UWZ46699.1 hypothetical protein Dmats_09885 [Dactylosporangium matsuzakiense]GLL08277.1 hypothetical protein GCM10017581_100380 [Dactylosporangium matsuzakiense]